MGQINLEHFEKELNQRKEFLVKHMEQLAQNKTRGGNALPADFSEQATEVENDEVVDGLESLEAKELILVNNALNRIKSGNYGICLSCEEEISENRLNAVPYTPTCINCSQ